MQNDAKHDNGTVGVSHTPLFDTHTHIGQFKEVYYDPLEVVETVMQCGIDGLCFSSSTSCETDVNYKTIEKEIYGLLKKMSYSPDVVRPFFWYAPHYAKQGITVDKAFESLPYKGIKLHPRGNHWDLENKKQIDTLHSLFDYAAKNNLPVLIHTGASGVDSPDRFEQFFDEYKNAKIILAHCRPLDTTLKMMKKYDNVCGDTAFTPKKDVKTIQKQGFGKRLIWGTDFPITHYFENFVQKKSKTSLLEHYKKLITTKRGKTQGEGR